MKSAARKKKIAIVSDAVYPFNKGGKEKRIYDITTRLAKQGYDVTIYCMKWWSGKRKTFTKDGVRFYAISPLYPLYTGKRRSIRQAVFFALHCFKLINKDFDAIDIDHMPHLVLFSTRIVCWLKKKRMVVTWHEVWGKAYWKNYLGAAGTLAYWIERASSYLPDTIIAVSSHTAENLRTVLNVKQEIVIVPNGFDVETISKNEPAKRGTDVIFAGRLLSHKNIDVLLQAIAIIAKTNPAISATIVGEGPEKERLEKLSGHLGLTHNVSFPGFLKDHETLYRAMRAARVFVLPSTREGFGIVALEANACGLPVVTIDHPDNAAKDLIVSNSNGRLSALTPAALARAISTTMEERKDPDFYTHYAEKYDWGNAILQLTKTWR